MLRAPMVKLVDTRDLKSRAAKVACRFDPGSGHHPYILLSLDLTLQSENREFSSFSGYHLTRFNCQK